MVAVLGAAQKQSSGNVREPQFADYSVTGIFHGTPAAPRLLTRGQQRFRTVIREWTRKGPNFAGHYTIAEWGCGSACAQIAVVDDLSGAVHEGPFGILPNGYVYFGPNPDLDKTGMSYRPNSALFIVRGCPNFEACGTYYYEWKGSDFKQLRATPMKPMPGSESESAAKNAFRR
jgi:hypothetical protein